MEQQQASTLPILQGFQLRISPNSTSLTIQAHETTSGKTFSTIIPHNIIPKLTQDLFSDPETLANGLKDAVNKSYPGLEISIDNQGSITYRATLSLGNIKKEYSFTINLIENKEAQGESILNEIEGMKTEYVTKLNEFEHTILKHEDKIKSEYDNKLAGIEKLILRMEEKLTERLDRLERFLNIPSTAGQEKKFTAISDNRSMILKDRSTIIRDPNRSTIINQNKGVAFNPASKNASYYFLSNNNQTVTLAKDSHPCIECVPTIPRTGVYSFTLQIGVQNPTTGICFGITQDVSQTYWNGNKSSYRYFTLDGEIVGKTRKNSLYSGAFGERAKMITMVVDMDNGALTFNVDGEHANSCSIAIGVSYYVYVSLGNPGDCVTIFTEDVIV